MAGLSRTLRQSLLNHIMGKSVYTPVSDFYIGLFTVAPLADAIGTEVSGINYTRILHNDWNEATAAEPSVITNDGNIVFPEAGGAWGTVLAFGIFDAETDGNLLASGSCSQLVELGTVIRFLDTELSISLDETV